MANVFISYSRKDSDFVHRLHDRLAAEGKDVWIDWEDIPPVAEWFSEISAAIEGADSFIFVLSPETGKIRPKLDYFAEDGCLAC